jgi:uncharacterized Zn finger protein
MVMSLSTEFRSQVARSIRERGENYARRNAVVSLSYDERQGVIEAAVVGTRIYHVVIRLEGEEVVDYECDCQYFGDYGEPCKHIWATVLAAERELSPNSSSPASAPQRALPQSVAPSQALARRSPAPPTASGLEATVADSLRARSRV